jgi:hypothetical protein
MRLIEGTSDDVSGPEDRAMQVQASRYATRYNRALEKWLAVAGAERREAPPPVDEGLPPGF